jgi:hypothetical protein
MIWLIGGVVLAVLLLVLIFAMALARASRKVGTVDDRALALGQLNDLKSPSGKPFYPEEDSLWKLAEELDDMESRGP